MLNNLIKIINYLVFYKKVQKDSFIFDREKDPNLEDIIKSVEKNGIAVIFNFFQKNECESVVNEVKKFIATISETDNNYIKNHGELNFFEMSSHKKTVVNFRNSNRNSIDGGMIDIFNVNKLPIFNCLPIFNSLHDYYKEKVESILDKNFKRFNLYINEDVYNTRVSHIDQTKDEIKCMLYLTDVNSIECGPYSYVIRSHEKKIRLKLITFISRALNRIKGLRNYSYHDFQIPEKALYKVLGASGTLIISNQSGIHRGMPQAKGNSRYVLVDNYY